MEQELQEIKINRAVLVGLNSPALSREENADEESLEELEALLTRAIAAAEQPPALDVSALEEQEELPLTVKNLYYGILSDNRAYSYAYDLTAELGEDGLLRCAISYMPYRTGAYPDGFRGAEVGGLDSLVQCARQGLTQESIPIRITCLLYTSPSPRD